MRRAAARPGVTGESREDALFVGAVGGIERVDQRLHRAIERLVLLDRVERLGRGSGILAVAGRCWTQGGGNGMGHGARVAAVEIAEIDPRLAEAITAAPASDH